MLKEIPISTSSLADSSSYSIETLPSRSTPPLINTSAEAEAPTMNTNENDNISTNNIFFILLYPPYKNLIHLISLFFYKFLLYKLFVRFIIRNYLITQVQ